MSDSEHGDGHAGRPTAGVREAELQFVEELGHRLNRMGLGRMEGRVFGWLLICDPPEQHAGQIAEALQASRGAISMAIRTLSQARLLERVPRPGDRRDYYRFPPDAWENVLHARTQEAVAFQQLMRRGLDALADAPAARTERLQRLHDLFEWFAAEFPKFMDSWAQVRGARQQARETETPRSAGPPPQKEQGHA
jgi:DNA-binding transcriptional regulator GbsR (MarR family)